MTYVYKWKQEIAKWHYYLYFYSAKIYWRSLLANSKCVFEINYTSVLHNNANAIAGLMVVYSATINATRFSEYKQQENVVRHIL